MKTSQEKDLYQKRFLAEGCPNLESLGVGYFQEHQGLIPTAPEILACIARLIDLCRGINRIVDVGCGPNPINVQQLLKMGYDAIGVEPIAPYVATAKESLVVLGRNNPSLYTVNGRPLYVHLNGLAIVLLK